jgi:uncharacterized RDD family membrane protein YckC
MHRAGILLRAAAAGIDLLAACLLFGFARLAAGLNSAIMPWERLHVARAGFCFLWLLYSSLEVQYAASPGKMVMGLRIGRRNAREAEFGRLLLRWSTKNYWLVPALLDYCYADGFLRIVTGLMIIVLLIGLLGAFNDDRLTWHDLWAGTAVWARDRRPVPTPRTRTRRRIAEYH